MVTIYTTNACPFCSAAKELLRGKGIDYHEIDVSNDDDFDALVKRTRYRTVPQIFINEELIGGFRELQALERSGGLSRILQSKI